MQRRIDDPTPQVSFHRHLDSCSCVLKGCNLNIIITAYISALAMLHHSVLQQVQLTSSPPPTQ